MEENIYTPPKANVDSENSLPDFYLVSPRKFLILFISTMGLYRIYWFYKHWACFAKANDEDMIPFLRAIFSVFFTHSLFNYQNEYAKEVDAKHSWSADIAASLCVAAVIISNIADRLAGKEIGSPFSDFVSIVLMPLICWTMYRAQITANIACGDRTGKLNDRLTWLNYIWIILGVLVWLLVIVGLTFITIGEP